MKMNELRCAYKDAFVTIEALMAAQNSVAMLGATCAVVGATASGI